MDTFPLFRPWNTATTATTEGSWTLDETRRHWLQPFPGNAASAAVLRVVHWSPGRGNAYRQVKHFTVQCNCNIRTQSKSNTWTGPFTKGGPGKTQVKGRVESAIQQWAVPTNSGKGCGTWRWPGQAPTPFIKEKNRYFKLKKIWHTVTRN